MKVIDAHIHFHKNAYFDTIAEKAGHENSAEHLQKEYARLGIEGAVVMGNLDLSLDPELHSYPPFMRYCLGLHETDLRGENRESAAALAKRHLSRKQCVGLKLYPGYGSFYVYDEACRPFLELAEDFQKPVAVHTGETAGKNGLLRYSHPLTVDKAASEHPGVQFVLCHWGNPWVSDAAAVMNKNSNVSADLSGLLEGVPDIGRYFEEQAGYVSHLQTWLHYMKHWDRLMYGTDFPLANMARYLEFVARLIPPRYHEAVFAENARRIYRLDF